MPGAKQVCPNSAACWSPAMPAIGIARRAAAPRSSPIDLARRHALPAASRAARRRAASSSSSQPAVVDVEQHRARGVGHVGDVDARRRSASRAASESTVPNASSPASARARAPGDVVEHPGDLGAGEIRVDHQPGLRARTIGSWPSRFSSSQNAAVRRSCQTIALCDRLAASRDPRRRVVSRWLVIPIAAMSPAPSRACASASRADADLRRPDLARVVLDPARLREDSAETPAGRRRPCRPARSKTMARELVVP